MNMGPQDTLAFQFLKCGNLVVLASWEERYANYRVRR